MTTSVLGKKAKEKYFEGIPKFNMSDSPKGRLILLPKQKYRYKINLARLTADLISAKL